ncbi:probable tubulin polyglutamylase ttll-15 [Plutella xylostella]|uniref:probable tubulin polyglutamylase ttll-15 n=1 Tax=Plutella xylostella TaxID=51655 RepID=UPI0020327156|nr:probable tubulin polyglutamylase ttll-15 [Plutella xylostella]
MDRISLHDIIMAELNKEKKRAELNSFEKSKKDQNDEINNNKPKPIDNNTHVLLLVCIIGVTLAIALEIINVQRRRIPARDDSRTAKNYWVYSASANVESKTGLLKHVHLVLERAGYEKSSNQTDWHLLWSHDYPFRALYPNLHRLKPHQKVNHFPGTGFITNKVDLATSTSDFIPKAFKLPQNKEAFMEYAKKNPKSMFLEKHNQHRGVFLKNVTEIDLLSGESFVQEYVQKPFLVDGHKFDIGVYVALTSVNPLRAYWYKGDVLFRYCPAKYYPFDPRDLDKYVVADDYLPTWEVPSLAHPYTALGLGMKDAFDVYVRAQGKDPSKIWADVEKAITEVFLKKEHHIIDALKHYPSPDNFFELMRFDLVLDEDLKVYLLEANMSPNLSSAHFPPNQLLYEQVLYSLFGLTGVAGESRDQSPAAVNMVAAQKNIAVFGNECSTICKDRCDDVDHVCGLCRPCLSSRMRGSLLKAHREFLHKGDFRRLFPPAMTPGATIDSKLKNLTETNKLQYLWYQGKCNIDVSWCN